LHVIPESGINTLLDWYNEIAKGGVIKNEYDEIITVDELRGIIQNRGREKDWNKPPYMYDSWAEFHRLNNSEKGPNGLLRHKIDNRHCVGHGEGTWDLITGEFS